MQTIKWLCLLILSLLFACESTPSRRHNEASSGMTVDWDKVDEKTIPKIREKSGAIGPRPLVSDQITSVSKKTQSQITALIAGAGGYRTIGLIALLKKLKEKSITPSILVGHGLSSIILAYYSMGFKADYIEWKFFKFFKELEEKNLFQKEWINSVDKNLLVELKKYNIEDGKLTLLIPIWNEKKKKSEFLRRGNLRNALLANIDPYNLLKMKRGPGFTHSFLPIADFKRLAINQTYVIDFVSQGISWKRAKGFLNGTFQKAAWLQRNSLEGRDNIRVITYPLVKFDLDDANRLPDIMHTSRIFIEELPRAMKVEEKL